MRTVIEVRPTAPFCVNDLRVAVEAAQRGLGMARAPRELIDEAGLIPLRLGADIGRSETRDIYAVYPTRRLVPRRVRLAVDWVARAAKELQDQAAAQADHPSVTGPGPGKPGSAGSAGRYNS